MSDSGKKRARREGGGPSKKSKGNWGASVSFASVVWVYQVDMASAAMPCLRRAALYAANNSLPQACRRPPHSPVTCAAVCMQPGDFQHPKDPSSKAVPPDTWGMLLTAQGGRDKRAVDEARVLFEEVRRHWELQDCHGVWRLGEGVMALQPQQLY